MNCPSRGRENPELLLDYSAAKLPRQLAAELEAHLHECRACSELVAQQQAVWSALDLLAAPEVSATFDRELYNRIGQQDSWWSRLIRPIRPALVLWRGPLVAATCLVITAGIVLEFGVPQEHKATSVEIVQPEQVVHALDDIEMFESFDHSVPPASSIPEL
ncbi:MAG: hypothetical protein JO323_17610 [Acidobacteriia bacterium]|nr:hypothetical protein [Terriglobia bacterium]